MKTLSNSSNFLKNRKSRIFESALLAAIFLTIYYVLKLKLLASFFSSFLSHWSYYVGIIQRLSLALFAIMLIVLLSRILERSIHRSRHSQGIRYNLISLTRLASYVCIVIIVVAFLFQNLYAAALSFGLISLVLGFALQAPITSFIGWLYIVLRRPYHVGDRIQVGNMRGVVVDIDYLDTIIREFSGDYLGNDRDSGRIIRFPNSAVLKSQTINYCGQFKPFIWNETTIQVAYTSDLDFVESHLRNAADEDFKEHYLDESKKYDAPSAVYFRTNAYAWLEVVVSYPVNPTDETARRNRILRRALPALNQQPDKVQFPQGAAR